MKVFTCIALAAVLTAAPCSLFAQSAFDDIDSRVSMNLTVSSLPEAQLGITQKLTMPFLAGEGPLTRDNNISLALTASLSPISIDASSDLVWTPIAFLQIAGGASFGSGWNISLFGYDIYGIGVNRADSAGKMENTGSAFDGLIWKTYGGAALQMDAAALFPGDWHHVIARSYHEINYKGYTGASAGESWYYHSDYGENVNGANYYGNFLVGYQMPLLLNMVALLSEMDLYLYDTPNRADWGDDKIRWTFSALFNFEITEKLSAAAIVQCRTMRNYKESNWDDLYYRNRTLDTDNPLRFEFFRAVVSLTYTF